MAATAYRIDGTHRTHTQLFPIGNGATFDDYGYAPTVAGPPKHVRIGQSPHPRLPHSSTVRVGQSPHARLAHSSTVRVSQDATITLPEE